MPCSGSYGVQGMMEGRSLGLQRACRGPYLLFPNHLHQQAAETLSGPHPGPQKLPLFQPDPKQSGHFSCEPRETEDAYWKEQLPSAPDCHFWSAAGPGPWVWLLGTLSLTLPALLREVREGTAFLQADPSYSSPPD